MYKDFTYKQTSMPDHNYKPKTLIGNWFEERCDPKCEQNNYFKERKHIDNNYDKPTLSDQKFYDTKQNWNQFQDYDQKKTFETLYMQEFKKPQEQTRNSELKPFLTKKGYFENNEKELEDYRKKWTKGNQVFDRNYLGIDNKKQ